MAEEDGLSQSLEDYLEAIFHVAALKGAARAKDIAGRLRVKNSSVTGALRALLKRGLINYAPYDLITLTDEGTKVALSVIQRHEALFDFLVKVLAVNKSQAEEAACKLEHSISQDILERLLLFVTYIDTCPLGGAQYVKDRGFFCKHKLTSGQCLECEEIARLEKDKS